MRYVADHDFHIHSTISPCCHDENQTPEAILSYAKENGFGKEPDEENPQNIGNTRKINIIIPPRRGIFLLYEKFVMSVRV